ncbi:MAG: YraN family protein [Pontibacterium sp.]
MDRSKLGKDAEYAAAQLLRLNGYTILYRNFYTRFGELDIVARNRTTLVFAEVRARTTNSFSNAATSVTPKKQQKLIAAAQAFLSHYPLHSHLACRFDVIAYDLAKSSPTISSITALPRPLWYKDAFRP